MDEYKRHGAFLKEATADGHISRHQGGPLWPELPQGANLMRAIKQAIDPDQIMNPGKIV